MGTTDNTEIARRVEALTRYNKAYRAGSPLIDDMAYDTLVEELRALDPDNAWLHQVEPEDFTGDRVRHKKPMLSTEKAYTREHLQRWVDRVTKAAKEIGLESVEFRVTPKLDGLAGHDDGQVFATRGNGRIGTNITRAFGRGVVPIGGRGRGLGEIVISRSWFEQEAAGEFDHPRNMCVGIIGADTLNPTARRALDAGAVHFAAYSELPCWRGSGAELVEQSGAITEDLRSQVDYALDGMVADATDLPLREHMGATSHHYRWQIAIKERGEEAETTVSEIVWQTGRTGNVTPVMLVEPVRVSGATISRVTAHNAGTVRDRELGAGARIVIIRSGEVIPKLVNVLAPAKAVQLPEQCESCSGPLEWRNDFLACVNHTACPAQVETGLRHFFKTLGTVDHFGPKTLTRLVAGGFTTLEQIYALTEEELLGLGFGPGQTANLLKALQTSLTESVEDARFLASFGIRDLGVGDSRNLLEHFPLEDLGTLTAETVDAIKGFGEITSVNITQGLQVRWDTIQHLLAMGFRLDRTPLASENTGPAVVTPIAGKRVLFTGKMIQGTRNDMKSKARELGADLASGISSNLDFLIIGEKPSPSKIAKAQKAGVQILEEAAYLEMIQGA